MNCLQKKKLDRGINSGARCEAQGAMERCIEQEFKLVGTV